MPEVFSCCGTSTATFTYLSDGSGKLQKVVDANGNQTVFTYDPLGRITDLVNRLVGTGAVLSQFSVPTPGGYDGAGNRLSVTATDNFTLALSGTTSYSYDGKDRLTGESSTRNGGYSYSYAYDNAGNATTFRGSTYGFNVDNQFNPGAAWTWDGQGNATKYAFTAAAYDAEGQLLSYGSGVALGNGWRPDGLRAWMVSSATAPKLYFLYDGTTPVLELNPDGTTKYINTFGALGLISRRTVASSSTTFFAFDERGNTAQRTNSTGTVLSSRLLDAYGKSLFQNAGSTQEVYDGFMARFGYWRNTNASLYLATYRFYDPSLGRWMTRDPIGASGGINLYSYMNGNPVMGADPSGLWPDIDWDLMRQFSWTLAFGLMPGGGGGFRFGGGSAAVATATSNAGLGAAIAGALSQAGQSLVKCMEGGGSGSDSGGARKPTKQPSNLGLGNAKFAEIIGWGNKGQIARDRANSLTQADIDHMRSRGLTQELAQEWADFYREFFEWSREQGLTDRYDNPEERHKLMQKIAIMMSKK